MGFSIRLFYLILVFFFFLFVGLLIAANPYLAIKVYPENQNVWQDCYTTPMARLRLLFAQLRNSSFQSSYSRSWTNKSSVGLLKQKNYTLIILKSYKKR